MAEARSGSLSELARLGFEELSQTIPKLERLVSLVGDRGRSAMSYLSAAASPDLALDGFIRLSEIVPKEISKLLAKEENATRLARVLGSSMGLSDYLVRNTSSLDTFLNPVQLPIESELLVLKANSDDELKRNYFAKLLQITDFDLSHTDYREPIKAVTAALSDLAAGALEGALKLAREQTLQEGRFDAQAIAQTKLAVIAMGKCGARELNYVSDVDVIYVADGDAEQTIEIATKLATKLARIISEPSLEPGLWQVDPNLRPEGKSGALVRRLESHLAYYEKWAEEWEFQALLKARFVAGDSELGARYESTIKPLVWSRTNRSAIVESARHLRKRVLDLIPAGEKDREIKLGRGGLRDVEFTAQLMQLVHGVTNESVRVPDTLSALEALAESGFISRKDSAAFSRHYQTLRAIEHRVQLSRLRRDHLFPNSETELRRVARGLGLKTQELEQIWRSVRLEVAALHDSVFYRPLLMAMANLEPGDISLSEREVQERLSALGFRDPKGAQAHISALTSGVSRRATIQRTLLPVLIRWMADGVDPDRALISFRRLSESLGETHWFLRMLRDSSGAAERLMRVLSSSEYIAKLLEHIPDSSEWFGDEEALRPIPLEGISSEMASVAERAGDVGSAAEAIRNIRRREVLRVSIGAVLGVTTLEEISLGLSEITDAYITNMLELAKSEINAEFDVAVVAMGRWGGEELGFGSDADGMLVYDSQDLTSQAHGEQIAQRLLTLVRDYLLEFELDLGLRPEGKNGPLIRSLQGYAGYYERWAEPWEFQALLRARVVSGSVKLQDSFKSLIDSYRYPESVPAKTLIEIRRIKARVEHERLPQGADPARHLKLGRGSLSDVEWLVQLMQIAHAATHPSLKTISTVKALRELGELGIIDRESSDRLLAGWMIASRSRSAQVLASDKRLDVLPTDLRQLEAMARILEYQPGGASQFEQDYLAATRKSRSAFEKYFA